MSAKYYCIMDSGNLDGKAGFRFLGSWMCRSTATDETVTDDLLCKLVLKVDKTIVRSNGTALQKDVDGRWSVSQSGEEAEITVADIIPCIELVHNSDDRFELAQKITQGEVMREMKPKKEENRLPPQYRYEKDAKYDYVQIDCIVFIDPASNLPKFFTSAVEAFSEFIRKFRKRRGEVQHFWFDSRLFTIAVSPDARTADRIALHEELGIPVDRPAFFESLNIFFKSSSRLLRSMHRSVPVPAKMEFATVEGQYYYYHYMVDKGLDDKGWGCAYRSLQTICSWFLLNGYTNRPVPTIRQIQEILVMIGDKQLPFINAPKWIGTLEASYILEHYLSVSCRIIHLNDIKEMKEHFFTLFSHFRNTRCPVMIGGGTLAHTLLGACYSEEKNIQKYLVLDPHYTGEDVLSTVIEKGFCGWKEVGFWKGSSYYNLCLPIPPKTV